MAKHVSPRPRIDVRRYLGRWVAIHPETHRIVADGATLAEARRVAATKGVDNPLLMAVPASEGYFVGLTRQNGPR